MQDNNFHNLANDPFRKQVVTSTKVFKQLIYASSSVFFNFEVQILTMVHNICIDYGQCDYIAHQIIHLNQSRHMVQHQGLLRLR
jgi:hypothetical protein